MIKNLEPYPNFYASTSQTYICNDAIENSWGYTFLVDEYNSSKVVARIPYFYSNSTISYIKDVQSLVYKKSLIPIKKKQFHEFSIAFSEKVDIEPLKNDFITMLGFIGLDALIKLIEKYKFYYITRFIAYIDAVENLNFLKQSNITVPINNLIFSVTRVQDVYSPDIKNESGVAIKIHDGFFEYSSIIFSDNEKIFNTDGYCFHNKVNFHDLHKTIYNILEFKMSKTIRNNVYPPLASYYNFFNKNTS